MPQKLGTAEIKNTPTLSFLKVIQSKYQFNITRETYFDFMLSD